MCFRAPKVEMPPPPPPAPPPPTQVATGVEQPTKRTGGRTKRKRGTSQLTARRTTGNTGVAYGNSGTGTNLNQ